MILTNCNETININCGCTLSFMPPLSSTWGRLSAGSLIGTGCIGTITDYIIDWYLNATIDINDEYVGGTKVLTTGSRLAYSTDIQYAHPFTGDAAIFVEYYGLYCPVIREVKINEQTIYGTPIRCRNYCNFNRLPSINIIKMECGMQTTPLPLPYDFRMYYKGLSSSSLGRNQTTNFHVLATTKYVAFQFTSETMYDEVKLYYMEEQTPIPFTSYIVGITAGKNGNVTPMVLDWRYIRVVVDLTQGGTRVVQNNDYIKINITGGPEEYTEWYFDIICLSESAFLNNCQYFNTAIKTFNFGDISLTGPDTSCNYTMVIKMVGNLDSYLISNLYKFSTIIEYSRAVSLNPSTGAPTENPVGSGYDPKTGAFTITIPNRVYFYSTIIHWSTPDIVHRATNKRYYWTYSNSKRQFIFSMHDLADYKAFMDSYYSMRGAVTAPETYGIYQFSWNAEAPYWQKNGDGTWKTDEFGNYIPVLSSDPAYYKVFQIAWPSYPRPGADPESGGCGDPSFKSEYTIQFHRKSLVTFSTAKGVYTPKGAELICTAKVAGVAFTKPTINNLTGDLDGGIVESYVNAPGVFQKTLIVLVGTSGSANITYPNGTFSVITFDTDLVTTASKYITNNSNYNYNQFSSQGVVLTSTQPTDYVNTMKIVFDTTIRDEYNNNFLPLKPDPLIMCNDTWTIINSWVNKCQKTYNMADWSGHSGCREENVVNGWWGALRNRIWTVIDVDQTYYFPFKTLNNVCSDYMNDTTGWRSTGTGSDNTDYEFGLARFRIRFDDPTGVDRTHYKIYQRMEPNTGALVVGNETTWTLLYSI